MPITAEQRRQLNRKRRDGRAAEAYAAILGDLDAPMLGACISLKEREDTKKAGTMAAPADALRYTECSLPALQRTLGKIQDKYGEGSGRLQEDGEGVFYDLGSGLGKACLQAAVCYPFEAVVGIEVLEDSHTMALELKQRYDEKAPEALPPSQRRSEDDNRLIDVPELEFRRRVLRRRGPRRGGRGLLPLRRLRQTYPEGGAGGARDAAARRLRDHGDARAARAARLRDRRLGDPRAGRVPDARLHFEEAPAGRAGAAAGGMLLALPL